MRGSPMSTHPLSAPRFTCPSAAPKPQATAIVKAALAPSSSTPSGTRCMSTTRTNCRRRRSTAQISEIYGPGNDLLTLVILYPWFPGPTVHPWGGVYVGETRGALCLEPSAWDEQAHPLFRAGAGVGTRRKRDSPGPEGTKVPPPRHHHGETGLSCCPATCADWRIGSPERDRACQRYGFQSSDPRRQSHSCRLRVCGGDEVEVRSGCDGNC